MLEEFKSKVKTHSPHGHYKQRAMQPSVEMFCIQKMPHCPVTIVLNSWGPDCTEAPHNIHLGLKPITALSVSKYLAGPPIFLCTAKYTNNCLYWVSTA